MSSKCWQAVTCPCDLSELPAQTVRCVLVAGAALDGLRRIDLSQPLSHNVVQLLESCREI